MREPPRRDAAQPRPGVTGPIIELFTQLGDDPWKSNPHPETSAMEIEPLELLVAIVPIFPHLGIL